MGEVMSLELVDDNYVYFTYDIEELGDLEDVNEEKIAKFLKKIFLDINDIYAIELFGYYRVDIYLDKKIGAFVEIAKIDDFISYSKKIDTKVTVSINNFYLKTRDLSKIFLHRPIYKLNDYYYVSTKDVDNISSIIEFCTIEYKDLDLKRVLI